MQSAVRNSIESGRRPIVSRVTEGDEKMALYRAARSVFLGLGLLVCAGCVAYGYDGHYPYPHHGYDIPPGHLPPPGECRTWYPDRPAGQQPPPGKC